MDSLVVKKISESYSYNYTNQLVTANKALILKIEDYLIKQTHSEYNEYDFALHIILVSNSIDTRNTAQAKKLLSQLYEIKPLSNYQQAVLLFWKAKINYSQNKYNSAITLYKKALKIFNKIKNSEYGYRCNYYLGLCHSKIKDYYAAKRYYAQALELQGKTNNTDYYYSNIYKLAYAHLKLKQLPEAIETINKIENYKDTELKKAAAELRLANLMVLKSYLYRQLAINHNDSVNLLYKSYLAGEKSIISMNKYMQKHFFENDQLSFSHTFNYIFYRAIEACDRYYKANPNNAMLYKALSYAEMDKSLAVFRFIQKQTSLISTGIPEQDIQHLNKLHKNIELINQKLIGLKQSDENISRDSVNIQKIQLIDSINQFEYSLENKYPKYKLAKTNLPHADSNFIKELSHKKQIVEYVISNEKVYTFIIDKGKIKTHHFEFNDSLFTNLKRFRELISYADIRNFKNEHFKEYTRLAFQLYKTLFEPLELSNSKPVLIIPDNELNLIPFEALLYEAYLDEKPDYGCLPYLVNNYDLSYANSLTILQHQMQKTSKLSRKNKVVCFAPKYNNTLQKSDNYQMAMRGNFDSLANLPGAQKEVHEIAKQVKTILFTKTQANECNFKSQATAYSIIHCAMHTFINDNNAAFSKMVFTPKADTIEDGLLHTYEINNLKLNSELLVLSACNTNYGELNKGEGLLSLSRSFIKAGCKSILSTLWSVSDETSADLINSFYSELSSNRSKSASISEAKRQFIKNHSGFQAHPFFWSGYVLNGNDSELKLAKPLFSFRILTFVILCSLLLAGYLIMRSRN